MQKKVDVNERMMLHLLDEVDELKLKLEKSFSKDDFEKYKSKFIEEVAKLKYENDGMKQLLKSVYEDYDKSSKRNRSKIKHCQKRQTM